MAKKMFKILWDTVVKGSGQGYLYVTTEPPHPNGIKLGDREKRYIYLHRAVMEKHLGRYLKPEEQVNHKDEDKSNNAVSNLEVLNRGEHQKMHALERGLGKYDRSKMKKASMTERVVLGYLATTAG